jgi:Fur family transcriptional regulator, ferric uptake regulator
VARDLHAVATARLRRDGQRYTGSRRVLVDVLRDADRPLSIPEVLDLRRDLAQSSAYRNLAVLERAGVVRRIPGPGGFSRYELAEELTGHHHHLICSACGSVADFRVSRQLERSLDRALERAADEAGFRVDGHRLDLVGTCRECG